MNTKDLERVRLGVRPAIFGPYVAPPPPVVDYTHALHIIVTILATGMVVGLWLGVRCGS